MSEVADVSDPSVKDTTGKTAEPSGVSDKSAENVGKDVSERDDVNMSHSNTVTKNVEASNTERGMDINPSVEDTGVDSMDADIPSDVDIGVEIAEGMERPTEGQGVEDTLGEDIQEVIPEDDGQKKKSKKRKHKKSADVGIASEPKHKLRDDDVEEVVLEEAETEEVARPVNHPTVDDEWLPEHKPQGDNTEEEARESEDEDIAAVITKRRKTTSKLKLNENRTRVGSSRIPKNIAAVPTANVSLNSEEKEAR
ncbi:hypothetical protein LIER_17116 [Lithospermum erythrorhizon]|uniref:Uncharacterized protein n=1 Tax=Lithospermum erythrorhizon TaxID=34254 RepID=A0AAV3Q964_LITER